MDISDLYDWEIEKVGAIWKDLNRRFMRQTNNKANLIQFAKVAHDEFLKAGFYVNVKWELNLVVNPATMKPYPIEIEILGRVRGADEDVIGFDHERKRHEVLKSKERGESFYGEKEKATG